eukprot:TRINITY_DN74216_c0_g1_i1.p1 TRINITY_DN74216_c0_g1~~TRINITY_DN74216_c0_g1_i1.p1  ORF type:complete len:699 (-),score=78.48 TRINITY_DN74216_c0_g1_i1:37-2133(-)
MLCKHGRDRKPMAAQCALAFVISVTVANCEDIGEQKETCVKGTATRCAVMSDVDSATLDVDEKCQASSMLQRAHGLNARMNVVPVEERAVRPLVLIPGLGKKIRIPLVRENLRLIRAELGPDFACVLVVYAPGAQDDPDFASHHFRPCHVRYTLESMWGVIKSVGPGNGLNTADSVFLVVDDHRLEASTLAKLRAVMANEPTVGAVSTSYKEAWQACADNVNSRPGEVAHGSTYMDFGVALFDKATFHCIQDMADPEVNGIGHGYDNMFTTLCNVSAAICDTCPTIHTSGSDQSYDVLVAGAQKEQFRAKLGKKADAWNECGPGTTYRLTGTSHSDSLLAASAWLGNVTQGILRDDLAMLSPAQLIELHKVQRGEVSKSQVEIVLAQYDEDVSWSEVYASIRTVYCKGTAAMRPPACVPLPNVGREGHTYLHHIVENYDNLAEWTVFSQAGEPTVGYQGHRLGGGHILSGVSFHDYVLQHGKDGLHDSDDGMFVVFTSALHLPTVAMSIRTNYAREQKTQSRAHQTRCPSEEFADGWEPWERLGWFEEYMSERCGIDQSQLGSFLAQFWEKHFKSPMPEKDMVFYAQGARFAASRARIHERPKQFYSDLLDLLSTSSDPCANYINEWAWYHIVGEPGTAPPCHHHTRVADPVPQLPFFLQDATHQAVSGWKPVSGRFLETDIASPAVSGWRPASGRIV